MGKTVEERTDELLIELGITMYGKDGAYEFMEMPYISIVCYHLSEAVKEARLEERDRCMKICKCGLADMEKEADDGKDG